MTSLRILLSLGNSLAFPCDDPQTVHQVTFHQPLTSRYLDHVNLGSCDGQTMSGNLFHTTLIVYHVSSAKPIAQQVWYKLVYTVVCGMGDWNYEINYREVSVSHNDV